MRVVRLQGGLGNQLFCLGFAEAVACITGETVGIDLESYQDDRFGRRFATEPLASACANLAILPSHRHIGPRSVRKILRKLSWTTEGQPPADTAGLENLVRRGSRFDGYWQNEVYMPNLPAFANKVRKFVESAAGSFETHRTVLHFRTYKEEMVPWRAKVLGRTYVRLALAAIAERSGPTEEVTLISDDPALAQEKLGDCGVKFRTAHNTSPFQDLASLMSAESLILTNSSFSWWGGVCSTAGIIVYPRKENLVHYPSPAKRFTLVSNQA